MRAYVEASSFESGASRPSRLFKLESSELGGNKKVIKLARESPEKLFEILSENVEGRIYDAMVVVEGEDSGVPFEARFHFVKEKDKIIDNFIAVYFYEDGVPKRRVYIEPSTERVIVYDGGKEKKMKIHDALFYRERILRAILDGESIFDVLPLEKRAFQRPTEKKVTTSMPKAKRSVNLFSFAEK